MGNDVCIWEMAQVFWETSKLCGKWLRSVGKCSNIWGNDLIIWQTAYKCGKWLWDFWNSQSISEMA